jgi:tRNA(fMet)-specific endonuclease VapC
MKYLLDTNVCIKYLNGRSDKIVKILSSLNPEDVVICSIVRAELYAGVYKSSSFQKTHKKIQNFLDVFPSLPFDDDASEIYGRIRASLEKVGKPIGPYDLQIASIAIQHKLILTTHNKKEFSRIKGLKIEDWE